MLSSNQITKAEKLFPADPELTRLARERVNKVKEEDLSTVCMPLLTMLCYITRDIYAACFPTFQVQLASDRIPVLGISPEFVSKLEFNNDIVFALLHEAMHLIRNHLLAKDPAKFSDPRWVEAKEAWINNYIVLMTGVPLIRIDGKVAIVDPKTVYEWSKKAAKDQNTQGFPSYEDFYETEQAVYDWLTQLGRNSKSNKNNCCVHTGTEGGSVDDASGTTPVLDDAATSDFVQRALESVMKKAVNDDDKHAKREIKALVKSVGDDPIGQQIFGDLGAYELLGMTTPEKKTSLWDTLMRKHIGRLLTPGTRLVINKKRFENRILVRRGRQKIQEAVIAIDTSGSMAFGNALEQIKLWIGKTNAHVTWLWWDGEVYPFKPGDEVRGGGGTDCRLVEKWLVENMKSYPDVVICVTDGFFTHFTPSRPSKWVWLLTKNGDHWPQTWTPPMNTVILPFEG